MLSHPTYNFIFGLELVPNFPKIIDKTSYPHS